MAVAIDEVTTEVTPADSTRGQPDQGGSAPTSASPQQERKQREQFERMQLRARRVCAN
jgi:hypothetical protein